MSTERALEAATEITSWGRLTRSRQRVARPAFRDQIDIAQAAAGGTCLAVGLRRSYGDSCLNGAGVLIEMTRLDRMMALDTQNRVLRAEAGASLTDILALLVPHGLFVPTCPGTRFVTLGGAVANDVHGKNHHRAGAFGRHVRAIGLLRSDGRRLSVSATEQAELFAATIGGLGLTGVIEWVELDLVPIPSAWLEVETVRFASLDAFWEIARASAATHEHTVAWIDGAASGPAMGRGIFSRANWAGAGGFAAHRDRHLRLPFDPPFTLVTPATIRWFNALYDHLGGRNGQTRAQHYAPFFFPLDGIGGWNRLYGRRGFYQYQCVIPPAAQEQAVRAMLQATAAAGAPSSLAVLKTFGELASPGLLSFPRAGATLALDLANRGTRTLELMQKLDAIVRDAAGALYPAKDARMSAEMFRAGYPQWARFAAQIDPALASDFWRRVGHDR
jgi:L-gulonolactone oxidase